MPRVPALSPPLAITEWPVEPERLLHPAHTALMLLDVQNRYLAPDSKARADGVVGVPPTTVGGQLQHVHEAAMTLIGQQCFVEEPTIRQIWSTWAERAHFAVNVDACMEAVDSTVAPLNSTLRLRGNVAAAGPSFGPLDGGMLCTARQRQGL
ncbi:MAG: hypothetical protein HW416_1337 [Chloroflexi bacterium]|nr:hypothetical protein [Chloroflexota bacterium]